MQYIAYIMYALPFSADVHSDLERKLESLWLILCSVGLISFCKNLTQKFNAEQNNTETFWLHGDLL